MEETDTSFASLPDAILQDNDFTHESEETIQPEGSVADTNDDSLAESADLSSHASVSDVLRFNGHGPSTFEIRGYSISVEFDGFGDVEVHLPSDTSLMGDESWVAEVEMLNEEQEGEMLRIEDDNDAPAINTEAAESVDDQELDLQDATLETLLRRYQQSMKGFPR
ncbi:hypothetical protein ESCO_004802 [Escovopsis weberi]|uniref:Uncharacterized protein n=1 Tax=Escovopsis weberi TaxID=150374 RepID=A0A0M8MZP3_ESCWE|nr:hypothetical protein ESCO_004802 [Escovopsis weberi]